MDMGVWVERWPAGTEGVVVLPDGRQVRGAGRLRGDDPSPQLAVMLAPADRPTKLWEMWWIRWPDFRLPTNSRTAVDLLVAAHRRAAFERVEVSCRGGVGRTGSALAVFAMLSGVPADGAVDWEREHYRARAVETRAQRRWVEHVVPRLLAEARSGLIDWAAPRPVRSFVDCPGRAVADA